MKIFITNKEKMTDMQALTIMREARGFIPCENNTPGIINEIIAIEEFSECTKEITKFIRGKGDRNHLIEEMADVYICLKHLQDIYRIDDEEIDNMMEKKFDRQRERNKNGEN